MDENLGLKTLFVVYKYLIYVSSLLIDNERSSDFITSTFDIEDQILSWINNVTIILQVPQLPRRRSSWTHDNRVWISISINVQYFSKLFISISTIKNVYLTLNITL